MINNYMINDTTTTNIKCIINIKNIIYKATQNCKLLISNNCNSDNEKYQSMMLSIILENLWILPENIKTNIMKIIGVDTENEIQNQLENHFRTKCDASAQVNNNITINSITINSCVGTSSKQPLYVEFSNTGSASANCYTNIFQSFFYDQSHVNDKTKNEQNPIIQKINDLSLFNILIIIGIICLLLFLLSLMSYIKTNKFNYNVIKFNY